MRIDFKSAVLYLYYQRFCLHQGRYGKKQSKTVLDISPRMTTGIGNTLQKVQKEERIRLPVTNFPKRIKSSLKK